MPTHYSGTRTERRTLDTFIKLTRCTNSVLGRLAERNTVGDLTWSQFAVLEALYHLGPMTQGEVSAKVLKSGSNITTVIDNLERDGAPVPVPHEPRQAFPAAVPPRIAPVEPPASAAPQPKPPAPAPVATPVVATTGPAPSIEAPVEEGLALPSTIAPVEGIVAVPAAQPPTAQPRAGTVPGSIVDLTEADSPPVAASRTAPAYPPIALRMRREGKVAVRLLVDESGYVADAVAVDASASTAFAAEAVKAARNWPYLPAKKDGVPVKVWITEACRTDRCALPASS